MSTFTDDVAQQCETELGRWNNGVGRETDDPYSGYVGEYWSFGVRNPNINGRTVYQDQRGRSFRPAWSSAFISYIYRRAGAASEFYYHEGHVHYVVKALRDAEAGVAKFLGRDPSTYAPKVGDIINAGRGRAASVTHRNVLRRYGGNLVPRGNFLPSHSDIVVAVDLQNRNIRTVGGNVDVDTVGAKDWALNADGSLVDGPGLICVIDCRL